VQCLQRTLDLLCRVGHPQHMTIHMICRVVGNPSPLSPTGIDILDILAPAPFSSASTNGRPLSPGLVPLSSRHASRDSSVITGSSNGAGITIDVLDAEPSRAGDGWRNLAGGFFSASAGPDPSEQRTLFGTVSLDTTAENLELTIFVDIAPSHPLRKSLGR
jgi:hypothetical protein